MSDRSTDDILNEIETLMKRDSWEDYDRLTYLFNSLDDRELTLDQYGKYSFYLNQF